MKLPVWIMFRALAPSGEIEVEIHERDPESPGPRIETIGCHLVVDLPHRGEKCDRRHLRIALIVRGDEIVLRPA